MYNYHGLSKTVFYKKYYHILSRCNDKKNKCYKLYGGRGIKCKWKTFLDFKKDMYDSFSDGMEIDRINNNGDYCKENCRWATRKQQMNNFSRNKIITYKNKTGSLSDLSEIFGFNYSLVKSRLNSGWVAKTAIEKPVGVSPYSKFFTYKGKTKNIIGWSKELGISGAGMSIRIKKLGIRKAIENPIHPTKGIFTPQKYLYNGKYFSLQQWSKISGLKADTLWNRIHKRNWPIKKAFEKTI